MAISNPQKGFFPRIGLRKRELVDYYVAVADGALVGVRDRPTVLKRFIDGAEGEPFFQKRVPAARPPWMRTATVQFPSGASLS